MRRGRRRCGDDQPQRLGGRASLPVTLGRGRPRSIDRRRGGNLRSDGPWAIACQSPDDPSLLALPWSCRANTCECGERCLTRLVLPAVSDHRTRRSYVRRRWVREAEFRWARDLGAKLPFATKMVRHCVPVGAPPRRPVPPPD